MMKTFFKPNKWGKGIAVFLTVMLVFSSVLPGWSLVLAQGEENLPVAENQAQPFENREAPVIEQPQPEPVAQPQVPVIQEPQEEPPAPVTQEPQPEPPAELEAPVVDETPVAEPETPVTQEPEEIETEEPSAEATAQPTEEPSEEPTEMPTEEAPTEEPDLGLETPYEEPLPVFEGPTDATPWLIVDKHTIIGFAYSQGRTPAEIIIPEAYEGRLLTAIGEKAFANANLASVQIAKTITLIEKNAFVDNQPNMLIEILGAGEDGIEGAPWGAGNAVIQWKGITQPAAPDNEADETDRDEDEGKDLLESPLFVGPADASPWLVVDSETGTISGFNYIPGATPEELIIPETYKGTTLTAIGEGAFAGIDLLSIKIAETIIEIGENAFAENPRLVKVDLSFAPKGSIEGAPWGAKEEAITWGEGAMNALSAGMELFSDTHVDATPWLTFDADTGTIIKFSYTPPAEGEEDPGVLPKKINVPAKINGVDVVAIAKHAFRGTALESVILPDSIITIGEEAFGGLSFLTSINLPEELTVLAKGVFKDAQRLPSIVLPAGLTEIGVQAFYNTFALTSITTPPNLESIGDSAFYMSGLKNITLNEGLTTIGSGAFMGTLKAALTIEMPASLRVIESDAFR